MPNNPYLLRDITVILDYWCQPTSQDPNQSTQQNYEDSHPWETARNDFANAMSWEARASEGTGLAIASETLQNHMDEAKAAVEALYSYGTSNNGAKTSVLGSDVSNTIVSITQADNFGQAAAAVIADCVPCEERILALLSLNPLKDVWGALETMYKQQVSFLLDLFDLILGDKSVQAFQDFCSLFKFLNFMCLPDLPKIIMMLASLMTKYALKLKDIQISFANIIGRMFGGSFTPLIALLDKYWQLIVAPVECIISALNTELSKMDVVAAWQTATGDKGKKKTISKLDEKAISEAMKHPMVQLQQYLKASRDEVEETLKKTKESILEVLGLKDKVGKNILDISEHIGNLSRMIGLVQASIAFLKSIKDGSFKCGSGNTIDKENFDNFMNTYKAKDLDIVNKDGIIVVKPKTDLTVAALTDVLGSIVTKQALVAGTTPNIPKVAEASIIVNNCLRSSPDKSLSAAKSFIDSL